MEIERFRKLTQKETKSMYNKALEDKYKVRQMEKQMDEVKPIIIGYTLKNCCDFDI